MIIGCRFHPKTPPEDKNCIEFVLERPCQLYPNRKAVVDGPSGQGLTYVELRASVNKLANGFRSRGLRQGDVICTMVPNSVATVQMILAVPLAGGIISGINPTFTLREVVDQINDTEAVAIVLSSESLYLVNGIRESCPSIKDVYLIDSVPGYVSISDIMDSGDDVIRTPYIKSREELAFLPYSSGTTGKPKGVMLTHHNINAMAIAIGPESNRLYRDGQDTLVLVYPLYHIAGLGTCLMAGFYVGATFVTYPKYNFAKHLAAMQKYKATTLTAPPPIMVRLAKDPVVEQYDLSSLKTLVTGAAPAPHSLIQEVEAKLNLTVRQNIKYTTTSTGVGYGSGFELTKDTPYLALTGELWDVFSYGMTETAGAMHYSVPEDIKPGSIGLAVGGAKWKIVDPSTGRTLPAGQNGEVCYWGPNVMKGYWKRPDATAATIDKDGWLHSGDLGHYDEDGHLYLVDRIKELIKYKGYQVAPAELEGLILEHPAVRDVAVVGVPDERAGELPQAHVVLKQGHTATAEDIYNHVKERAAPYKWLRGGVGFVDSIPKNPSGKILRRVIRSELAAKMLKSQQPVATSKL